LLNNTNWQLLFQFADDNTLILEGDECYLHNLVDLLRSFAQASGLYINREKSIAYWFASNPAPPWLATFDFPWVEECSLSKLLGISFGLNLDTQDIDAFLLGKVTKKLGYWVNVHFFLEDRVVIVNSVFFSMLWYFISIFGDSLQVIRQIKSTLRDFLWLGSIHRSRARVQWNDCCLTPKIPSVFRTNFCSF
jgi:hypothetical protein